MPEELTPEEIEAMEIAQAKRDRVTRFIKMRVGPVYDKMYEDGMTLAAFIAWIESNADAEIRKQMQDGLQAAHKAGVVSDKTTVEDILAEVE